MTRGPAGPTLPVLGQRVVLTAIREDDIDRIAEACSQPEFERYMTTPWPYRREDAEWFVREFVPAGWRGEGTERTWAIREERTGPLMGVIGLRYGDEQSLGYYLHPDARGRGLAADAVRTVVRQAFECLGYERVEWSCVVGNEASMRVAQAAGFEYTGARLDGADDRRGEHEAHHAVRWAPGARPDAPELPWPVTDR